MNNLGRAQYPELQLPFFSRAATPISETASFMLHWEESIMEKDDPLLKSFNEPENKKEKNATAKAPYVAFKREKQLQASPFKPDGTLDKLSLKRLT